MTGTSPVETTRGQSWSGLATCYEALGDSGKALEIEIMAAHMTTDADTWRNLAEKSKCAIVTKSRVTHTHRRLNLGPGV